MTIEKTLKEENKTKAIYYKNNYLIKNNNKYL